MAKRTLKIFRCKHRKIFKVWLVIAIIASLSQVKGVILVNFTVVYTSVASDEIVILQNAIEDLGRITNMSVVGRWILSDDVPPRPVNLTATALSSTEINVEWSPVNVTIDGNLTVIGYTVFYRRILDNETMWNRIATESSVNQVNLTDLAPANTYTIRVLAFHSMGNGLASEFFDERTHDGVPSEAPGDLVCESLNPFSVSLRWTGIQSRNWHGNPINYTAKYRIFGSLSNFRTETFDSNERQGKIQDLKPNTRYEIHFAARTRPGIGPKAWCTPNTQEGVPTVGPNIIQWELDSVRQDEAFIEWDHIPEDRINGYLTGYVVFHGVSRDGTVSTAYPEFKNITIQDPYANSIVIKKIPTDAQITVKVAGMTKVGIGADGKETLVESCTCPRNFYAAWFEKDPYVDENEEGTMGGIFPKFLNNMMAEICSGCTGLRGGYENSPSVIYWDRSKDGRSPKRDSETDLKEKVEHNVHFHAPVFMRSEIRVYRVDYRFVSVINSQGVAFIVRDPFAELDKTAAIMSSLASCWPAILIIVAFSMVAGIVIWVLDCEKNSEEFPNENFFIGAYHGAYWAFVSMTTVGYGDKTPRSCCAQFATILWMLMGPIINGVVIGAITTSLTTISLEEDPIIYGTKVGAIAGSYEYEVGIRRNAKMNTTDPFTTNEQMLEALEYKEIDGVLMDSIVAGRYYQTIVDKKMKISKLIKDRAGWGLILSSDAVKIERQIRSYIEQNQERLQQEVENRTSKRLTVKAVKTVDLDTGIVDPKSKTFKDFMTFGSTAIIILTVFGILYQLTLQHVRKTRVKPKAKVYRDMLLNDLAVMISSFCEEMISMVTTTADNHESELKRFCWQKGYSFGIDGWVRQKTSDEEMLKKDIRYQEIMFQDLGFANENKALQKWKKQKSLLNPINVVPPKTIPV